MFKETHTKTGNVHIRVDSEKIEVFHFKRDIDKKIGNTWVSYLLTSFLWACIILFFVFLDKRWYYLSILILFPFVIILYLSIEQEKKDLYNLAENPDNLYKRFEYCVDPNYASQRLINHDDPIINTGAFFISSEDDFNFLISKLTSEGKEFESLRYLQADEYYLIDRDSARFGGLLFLPVLIAKSWKIYPLIDFQNYIAHEMKAKNIKDKKELFYDFYYPFSLNSTIKSYYEFDYSDTLKYDLTCEYGDISLSKKYGAAHFNVNLQPTDNGD